MNKKNWKYLLNKLQEIKLYLILHTLVTYRFVFSFKRQKVKHPQCIKHPQWIKSIYSIINESQKAVYVTSSTVGCTWVVINHSTWQTIPGILLHCSFGINIYYPTYIYIWIVYCSCRKTWKKNAHACLLLLGPVLSCGCHVSLLVLYCTIYNRVYSEQYSTCLYVPWEIHRWNRGNRWR